jgi:Holliday junction resolvasome RuvABC endonuclease subunit
MKTIAIDPGTKHCGWALFVDGRFDLCGLVRSSKQELPDRVRQMAREMPMVFADHVVIERPEVYRSRFLKGDPNDLISVAIVVGALVQAAKGTAEVDLPKPKEWKGQAPKEVTDRRIRKALSVAEFSKMQGLLRGVPLSLQHNVIDAVALGLWATQGERHAAQRIH